MNKTPGQIGFEGMHGINANPSWWNQSPSVRELWECSAQAVLQNQWRPVGEPPEKDTQVLWGGGHDLFCWIGTRAHRDKLRTHWMPIPPPPAPPEPTPEEKERAAFEAWLKAQGGRSFLVPHGEDYEESVKILLFAGWQARAKEGAKS